METIKIPFSGINRSIDEGISNDGQCMELINARIKNGSVEPIGMPLLLSQLPDGTKKLYYHSLVGKYICITNNGEIYSLNEDFSINERISSELDGIVERVEFVGKIICFITDNGMRYMLSSGESYHFLGEKPSFSFNVWGDSEKEITIKDKVYDCLYTEGFIGEGSLDYRDVNPFLDFVDACKNEALAPYLNEYRTAEPLCIQAAIRMYDGSYVCHSPIYLMCPMGKLSKSFAQLTGSYLSSGVSPYLGKMKIDSLILSSYILKYSYNISNFDFWKDLILSLDVFVSRPFGVIDAKECLSSGISFSSESNQIRIKVYDNMEAMLDRIISESSKLYLSVSLTGSVGDGTIEKIGDVNGVQLTDYGYSYGSLHAHASYVYNNRLHLGNIKTILFKGFINELKCNYNEKYNGYKFDKIIVLIKSYTYLSTDEGEKIVYNEEPTINPLNPLVCYPDTRAKKIVMFASLPSSELVTYRKVEINLTASPSLNMAFYLKFDWDIEPIDLYSCTKITEEEFNNPEIILNNAEYHPNKIKVSSLNNPFSFPPAQTYQNSNEAVIGMCANTNALSQGQFGQHPLYVFAKDGIYAMSVGTGGVTYSAQVPVSRDTCVNKNSIKGIDQAVVFASKRGLMMIGGNSAQLLSGDLDGYLPSCIISSPIIPKIANVASMKNVFSNVTFNEYIEGAEVGYNYQENELYVSNKKHSYAYAFSITSSSWSKIYPNPSAFVNRYPDCLAIIDNGVYDMQNNHRSISKILLMSKPIKMGSSSHKRILQTALRGIVKRAMSDLYLRGEPVMFRGEELSIFSDVGLYILGSNDAEHFTLISGKESIVDVRDLVSKMNKSKPYKYFMVALVGGVRTDVSLNYMEFVASEAFANRLR